MHTLARQAAFVLLFVVLSTPEAWGQSLVMAGGGLTIPVQPDSLANSWTSGAGLNGAVAIPIASPLLVRISADAGRFGVKDSDRRAGRALVLTADLMYVTARLDALLRPYVVAGIGYSRVWDVDPDNENEAQALSISPGAGVFFVLANRFGVFGEARYVLGFTDPEQTAYGTIRLGVAFSTQ